MRIHSATDEQREEYSHDGILVFGRHRFFPVEQVYENGFLPSSAAHTFTGRIESEKLSEMTEDTLHDDNMERDFCDVMNVRVPPFS